ncbi:MAG: Na(+)/H(+) antiporter subunit [Devosia sp.]|uniref:MnhB domain-containing protein n=1 Tax=Devosia sp. TaxID=1871048 RepID=UPI00260A5025|nr:MnhB domain-containing protein [Devosia sp.]MDB5530600.1 Na(+)/H(+) antiporter subunit [Devosia sp.]
MNTLIFRTMVGPIVTIMLIFSAFICLRGHNAPGGGFIGGLIAAAAIAVLGIAGGATAARKALRVDPLAIAGFGVVIAALSGLGSMFTGSPFLTSIWAYWPLGETTVPLSTPLVFDIGVYLVVLGTLAAIALVLEEEEGP